MFTVNLSEAAAHVHDDRCFHVPVVLWEHVPESWQAGEVGAIHCPSIPLPVFNEVGGLAWHWYQLSRYMVVEALAAVILMLIFIPLAYRISRGGPPKGRIWNFFEAILLFIRDQVARPAIGGKEADRFLPFLWTGFFFVLTCNLMGLVPWLASPTGSIATTVVLAGFTLLAVLGAGMARYGPIGFWIGQVPHLDVPLYVAIFLWPMLFVIEVVGLLIRHFILALRLLANMFAGHLVLAVVISFVAATAKAHLLVWVGVTTASVLGCVALSLLELFVALLQAYVFVFLSALLIGMAVHQH